MAGLTAALAAGVALVVTGAPRAVAAGPTSVLVVSPESGESAALHVSDEEYGELERALGELGEGRREQPPGLSLSEGSRQINVTWMVHDVMPGRVDRAYPAAPGSEGGEGSESGGKAGTVWIHTTADVASMAGTWHKAKDPARLTALFKKLGVMGAPSDDGRRGPAPGAGGADPAPPAPEAGTGQAATGRAEGTRGDGGTDWWWAIPGAAGGAAGALLLRGPLAERRPLLAWLRGRRRPHEDGPRQELRDL
ncbi:hypothetical protein ABZ916_02860 [Streptomyces sp. NPDC046853]|uniref:hypothetical protein n=1 Tax=Streptomyces sp. NPDC046853 TaxID=3154920 RepID=UPI0033D877E3